MSTSSDAAGAPVSRRWLRLSLGARIYGLIAFASLCQIGVAGYQLAEYREGMLEQRQHELTNLTAIALSILKDEHAAGQAGASAQPAHKGQSVRPDAMKDAQARAKDRISKLKFGEGDYFWIQDLQARIVMHPVKPELNGRDMSETKDPNGKRLFSVFADVARSNGHGFVDYL